MKTKVNFRSENILFSPLEVQHIELINNLHAFPEVAQYNTIGVPKDREATAKILEDKLSVDQKNALGWALLWLQNAFKKQK